MVRVCLHIFFLVLLVVLMILIINRAEGSAYSVPTAHPSTRALLGPRIVTTTQKVKDVIPTTKVILVLSFLGGWLASSGLGTCVHRM